MAEMKRRRRSWKAFLQLHEQLREVHPSNWKIDWATLPKTMEKDHRGDPVYFKTGRNAEPACVLVHEHGNLVARRYRSGFWEAFDYNDVGQMLAYQNSLGADIKKYWSSGFETHPAEIHTGHHRWVRVSAQGLKALYWCAFTGLYKDDDYVFSRDDLWEYFAFAEWGERKDADEVYGRAVAFPATTVGRFAWRLTQRDPSRRLE